MIPGGLVQRLLPALFCILVAGGCSTEAPVHEIVSLNDGCVKIPVTTVDDGRVHFFTYHHDGRNVNFLVRTDGEGTLHAHLDACYACYRYKRGFVFEDPHLVCIACRLEYAVADEVWDYIGACAPISVHSKVVGDELTIDADTLKRAARYF